jgi:hypothetical protein
MKFVTKIMAIDPKDKKLKHFMGPVIESISFKLADEYLQINGLGYCEIDGILISEVDEKTGIKTDYTFENN